ncbi:MAG: methyltransferase family protein [bacterium]
MKLETKIPPPVYMLLFGGGMWLMDRHFPVFYWNSLPWTHTGWAIMGVGLLIELAAIGLFLKANTTANPMKPANASHLVHTGLYRYTRNPMYLGIAVVLTGWFVHLGSLSPIIGPPLFIFLITHMQIRPEEQALAKVIGQTYLDYKQKVPRWL